MNRLLLGSLGVAVALGCAGPRPPRVHHEFHWPSPAPLPIETALQATAAEAGLEGAVLPDGTVAPAAPVGTHLPYDATGVHARSGVFEGLWYAEVVLGDVDPEAPLPLVVALHGRGDRPRLPAGPFLRTPTPMRVLLPRGPLALGDGYAWGRYSVASGHPDELASDLSITADRVAALVEHVRATRPTLGTPIVTGFSQGAILGWIGALRHPDTFALGLFAAGWVPPAAMPTATAIAPIHVRAMHGVLDPVVPIEGTRAVVLALRALGHDVELVEVDGVAHVVTLEMDQRFEAWLEEALAARAPGLGGGLGLSGPDPVVAEPVPLPLLEDETEVAVPAPVL